MHILHVTPYYAPAYAFGGVVRAVQGLAETQAQNGHHVTVLTTDALTLDSTISVDQETLNGVTIYRVPNRVYRLRRYNLSTPFGMGKIATDLLHDVDVIHMHEFRTTENLLVLSEAQRYHIPVVLSPHGTINLQTGRRAIKNLWDSLLSPRIAPKIDHVIALAQAEKDDVAQLWQQFSNSPDISIIPNGIHLAEFDNPPDAATFRQKYDLDEAKVILFMGRLHERKGVLPLLQAFLKADLPNTKLVFAGPDEGMRAQLKSLANEHVMFTGYLSGDERLQALSSADIFALPAVGEGLSMAVLEAMATGVPVLLSPGCNLPEAQTANAGLIVDPTSESLTQALQMLLNTETDLTQMSANAQQLVKSRFTWDVVAAQLDEVYKQL